MLPFGDCFHNLHEEIMVELEFAQQRREPVPFSDRLLSWSLLAIEIVTVLLQALWLTGVAFFRVVVPEARKSVRGKTVLITGAGHGLGRRLALNFGRLGAKVILWDIDQEKNTSVAKEILEFGGQAWAYHCDVSDEKQVEEVGATVRREVGEVRILINNAGVLPGKPIMCLNSYQIRKTFEINTLAHFWTIRQFLPNMLEVGDGHIVAVSSIAGVLGCANLTDYCASKYGVLGLMAALREDLYVQGKEANINLTAICPAVMDTGLVQRPKSRFPKLFPILKVEEAADAATDAILKNKRELLIPAAVNFVHKITSTLPCTVRTLTQRFIDYTIDPNIH